MNSYTLSETKFLEDFRKSFCRISGYDINKKVDLAKKTLLGGDLKLDDFDVMGIVLELERKYSVRTSDDLIEKAASIEDLYNAFTLAAKVRQNSNQNFSQITK
jgi:acyl carrier protein